MNNKIILAFLGFIVISLVILLINTYLGFNLFYYVFTLSITVIIILMFFGKDVLISNPIAIHRNTIDIIFLVSSILLVFLTYFESSDIIPNLLRICLSLLLSFFLFGWIIIRYFKHNQVNKIASIVISFSLSIGLNSIIYTGILLNNVEPSGLIVSLLFFLVSTIPIIHKYLINKKSTITISEKKKEKYSIIEISVLGWLTAFFLYSISSIYPAFVDVPGYDIVRHYGTISLLPTNEDIFQSPYPWFHFSLAFFNDLSGSDRWLFQTAVSFTSILIIFSFYIMAKAYLYKFNRYAHLLSTIIFTSFSGLGWIFYYQNLPALLDLDQLLDILSISYVATYFDIGVGQSTWLWLWYRPITAGFVLTFLLLYLLKNNLFNGLGNTFFISFILITLGFVHFPGFLTFILIIFILALLIPRVNLRLKEMLHSIIISIPLFILLIIFYELFLGTNSKTLNLMYLVTLEMISILALIFLKYPNRKKIRININHKRIISIILLIYSIIFVFWLTNIDQIKTSIYNILGYPGDLLSVPIVIYPALLGLAGFLAIPALVFILKKDIKNPLVIFPIIFIFVLILGKIISFINFNYSNLDYWERRLIPYLWISVSILSSIVLLSLSIKIKSLKPKIKSLKYIKIPLLSIFITLVLIGGTLSTFITIDYQSAIISRYKMSGEENILLNNLTMQDPYSTLLTLTDRSKNLAEYLDFYYKIGYYRDQIWPSQSPELPLYIMSGLNTSALIYLNNKDFDEISNRGFQNTYLTSHLLNHGPTISKNDSLGKIIKMPPLAPVSSTSHMVLIIPNELSKSSYFAYDFLSAGRYNFTTAILSDISTIRDAKVLVVSDESIADIIIQSKDELDLKFENLIVLNLNGYEVFGQVPGRYINSSLENNSSILSEYKDSILKNNIIISRQYNNPLNLSSFDSIKVNWIGHGSDKYHIIQYISNTSDIIEYKFKDSWIGPKQIFLPMNLINDTIISNEIPIQMNVKKNTSWSDVRKISILTFDAFPNLGNKLDPNNFLYLNKNETSRIYFNTTNYTMSLSPNSIIPSKYSNSFEGIATFDNNVPFILKKDNTNFVTYLVNLFPLVEILVNNKTFNNEIYNLYDSLLDHIDLDIPDNIIPERSPSSLVTGGIATFSNAVLSGNITTITKSAIINTNTSDPIILIDDNFINHKNSNKTNLVQITPINLESIKIMSNFTDLRGEYGFYTHSEHPHNTIINFTGNPVILNLLYNNNDSQLIHGKNIIIITDNSEIVSRQPKIIVDGISNLTKFYTYGELNDKLRILGKDTTISGKINFNVKYADKFILVENAQFPTKDVVSWTDYFRDMEKLNLINLDNIVIIMLFVIIFIVYNYYLTTRKRLYQK